MDNYRKHLTATGTCPNPKLIPTAQKEKILAIMAAVKEPLKNEFDDDDDDVKDIMSPNLGENGFG